MSDQVTTVDPEEALLAALDDAPKKPAKQAEPKKPETTEEPQASDAPPEETEESADEAPEEEAVSETESEPEVFKITVKDDSGHDVEKEVTLDELAKGYMLQADYTRKTQALSKEKQKVESEYSAAFAKAQQSAVESITQLQELVLQQAAPELNGVDWVTLSIQEPSRFVQLQAKQQQLQGTFQALEQRKAQFAQQREALIQQQEAESLRASEEMLTQAIPELDAAKVEKLYKDIEASVGWTPKDLKFAVRVMAEAGMQPDTFGKFLLMAHQAAQFRELKSKAPTAMKKVAQAPKIIKPGPAQPKPNENKAALERLKKHGRIEDLVKLL